ncbi:MAG: C39 family peptidase [Desulfovibrio sp.]
MTHARPHRASGPPSGAALAFSQGRAARGLACALLLALVLVSLGGCALTGGLPAGFVPPPGQGRVTGVPFHAQEDLQCGPASLAMVLNHLGDPVTPEEISRALYRKDLRGVVSLDLALYPRGRGFATRFFRGSEQDVAAAVDAGQPLLVMVDEGFGGIRVLHFMVVTGYDAHGVLVNSGRSQGLRLGWGEFLSAWDGADRWALRISPAPPKEQK